MYVIYAYICLHTFFLSKMNSFYNNIIELPVIDRFKDII